MNLTRKSLLWVCGIVLVTASLIFLGMIRSANHKLKTLEDLGFEKINKTSLIVSRENFQPNWFSIGFTETVEIKFPELSKPLKFTHNVTGPSIFASDKHHVTGKLIFDENSGIFGQDKSIAANSITNWEYSKKGVFVNTDFSDFTLKNKDQVLTIKDGNFKLDPEGALKGSGISFVMSGIKNDVEGTHTLVIDGVKGTLNAKSFLGEIIDNMTNTLEDNKTEFKGITFTNNQVNQSLELSSLTLSSKTTESDEKYTTIFNIFGENFKSDAPEIEALFPGDDIVNLDLSISIYDLDKNLTDKFIELNVDSSNATQKERRESLYNALDKGVKAKASLKFGDAINFQSDVVLDPQSNNKIANKLGSLAKKIGSEKAKEKAYLMSLHSESEVILGSSIRMIPSPIIMMGVSQALSQGYLVPDGNNYKSHIESKGPIVKVNGKIIR